MRHSSLQNSFPSEIWQVHNGTAHRFIATLLTEFEQVDRSPLDDEVIFSRFVSAAFPKAAV